MTEEKSVYTLENKLARVLRPITPRKEFVRGLGRRVRGFGRTILDAGADTWTFILLVLAGILSLGLLLALIGRALFNLLGVRKQESEST